MSTSESQQNNLIERVALAFKGPQRKATIVLLTSVPLMITWKYFGGTEFYHRHFADRWVMWGDPDATAALYYFGTCFLLLGVVPMLLVKFAFGERLSDYGVGLGDRRRTLVSMLLLVPFFMG